MRVRKLGNVTFDKNAIYVEQDFTPNGVMATVIKSAAGNNIEFVAQDYNPEITLIHNNYSLVSGDDMREIIAMWKSMDETTITYVDGSTQAVRFRMDKPPIFAEWATCTDLYYPTVYLTAV